MLRRVMRTVVFLGPAMILTVSAGGPALALEDFRTRETRTLTVGERPEILIEAISWDVSYTAIPGTVATVDIEVVVRAADAAEADRIRDEVRITVEGGDGFLTARVEQPRRFPNWIREILGRERGIRVSFHVQGPAGATGEIASVSGDVEADGITGRLEISTVSGDVTARRLSGPTRIGTVSGDLLVRGAPLGIDAETTSGDVTVEGAGGTVRIETVSGDLMVDQQAGGFDVHSTSGAINVRSAATAAPLAAHSTSGDISLMIDPSAVGEATLESSSGEIRMDLIMHLRSHGRRRLVGQVGTGTAPLHVSTTSGEIIVGQL